MGRENDTEVVRHVSFRLTRAMNDALEQVAREQGVRFFDLIKLLVISEIVKERARELIS